MLTLLHSSFFLNYSQNIALPHPSLPALLPPCKVGSYQTLDTFIQKTPRCSRLLGSWPKGSSETQLTRLPDFG
jgi:hypothetical protein